LPTAAFGGEILLAEYTNPGVVGAYDSTSGALVNSNLLTTNSDLTGIGVSGSDVFVANEYGTVGEYTTSGGTVNSSLITESGGELGDPVVIGSNLFVANYSTGVIGEYNATSGATVNASLISGLAGPYGLATDGTNLYITDYDGDTISEYTTSGGVVNASLVSGLSTPTFIAVIGSDLFVTEAGSGCVGEYTTSGATVSSCLIYDSGGEIWGLTTDGTNLYVGDYDTGIVGEYTTSGTAINASLFTGPSAYDIAYAGTSSTPEPASLVLTSSGLLAFAFVARKRRVLGRSSK
jgi:hypothetical protein